MEKFKNLEKKLEELARALSPQGWPRVVVRNEEITRWNFKKNVIIIGVKLIPENRLEEICTLLLGHEMGHYLFTDPQVIKEIEYPKEIFYILEDARVDEIMSRYFDFSPLYKFAYEAYYEEEDFKDPFNIGVLLRWKKMGINTRIERPPGLPQQEFQKFIVDWENILERAINAKNSFQVFKIGKEFFDRWRYLFEAFE